MKRLIWKEDRFSWWFVGVFTFVTASILVADFVWRFVTMPIKWFVVYAILVDLALGALAIMGGRWWSSSQR
jgi:hypothetical protein